MVLERLDGGYFQILSLVVNHSVGGDHVLNASFRLRGTTPEGAIIEEGYSVRANTIIDATFLPLGPQYVELAAFAGMPLRSLTIDTTAGPETSSHIESLMLQTPLPPAAGLLAAACGALAWASRRRPRAA